MAVCGVCLVLLVMVVGSVQGQGDGVFFSNVKVPNHWIVTREDIGTSASNAVQCQTTVADCCTDSYDELVQWSFPNDDLVSENSTEDMYQEKGPGYLYLQRNRGGVEGIYQCVIPTRPHGHLKSYYVGVYSSGNGEVSINDPIGFNLDNAATSMFTLTCTSTGGPATTVTWTVDGSPQSGGTSQIMDQSTATYSNTLTVTGSKPGVYQCSVSNARNVGSPATQSLALSAADPPTDVSATQDGSTITVSWTPPTMGATPTGYMIYLQTGNDYGFNYYGDSVMVDESTTTTSFNETRQDLIYYITMVTLSDELPSVRTTVITGYSGLFLLTNVSNHGIVTLDDVGTLPYNALQCWTQLEACCGPSSANTGDWYLPNNIPASTVATNAIYQVKGPRSVYLQRNSGMVEGIYRCDIPEEDGLQSYYCGLYSSDSGQPSITDIQFTLDTDLIAEPLVFTLNCISTGGPATTVTWTSPAGADGIESQTVTDMSTATYSNTLTVAGRRHTGDYQCSVSNARNKRNAAVQSLTVTDADPPTDVSATQDDSTITVSWTPPTTGATPTGYVIYYQASGDQGSVMVNSGSATQQVISDRQADHLYIISMVTLCTMLPSTQTPLVIAVRPDTDTDTGSPTDSYRPPDSGTPTPVSPDIPTGSTGGTAANTDAPGAASTAPGTGSTAPGAGSTAPGAGNTGLGAGSASDSDDVIIGVVVAVVALAVAVVIVVAVLVGVWLVLRHKQAVLTIQKGTSGGSRWNEVAMSERPLLPASGDATDTAKPQDPEQ